MFAKYHRCYYQLTKELFDRDTPSGRRRLLWYLFFDYFFLSISGGHLLFASYMIATNFCLNYNYQRYDPLVSIAKLYGSKFDAFVVAIFFIMGSFYVACDTELYWIDVHKPVWQFWRQLVVQSQDDYEQCQLEDEVVQSVINNRIKMLLDKPKFKIIQKFIPIFALNVLTKRIAKLIVFINLENINQQQWKERKLSIMPNMSLELRRKIILMLILIDKIGFWVQVQIPPLCIGFYILHFTDLTTGFHWLGILWVIFDSIGVVYGIIRLVQVALWFTSCCIFVIPAFAWQSNEILSQMEHCINRYRAKRLPIPSQMLHQFLFDHNAVCQLFVAGKREIFADVQFIFLATNIPINIYIIQRLVFHQQNSFELAIIVVVLTIQSSAGYISLGPLAYVCKCLHRPLQMLPALQQCLTGRRRLLYKLKLDDLAKRLGCGPKYAITIGPLMEVTDENIMEIVGIYVAYLLMVFSAQIEAGLERAKSG